MKLLPFCALMSLSGRGGEKNTRVRRTRRRRYKIPSKKEHYCPIYVSNVSSFPSSPEQGPSPQGQQGVIPWVSLLGRQELFPF